MTWDGPLERIDDTSFRIPPDYRPGMRVPGVIFADVSLIDAIKQDQAPEQVANVACLPGIVQASLAMPDIHWGYGFPIGGVAATDVDTGVLSPGGVGYDINCGVRLLRTTLLARDVQSELPRLVDALFSRIPTGVGSGGMIKLSARDSNRVLERGAAWAVQAGYGRTEDLECTEEGGSMPGGDPADVSSRAQKRGYDQLGTLGSGNHFLEIGVVTEVFDERVAGAFGLFTGELTVMIHSGSRGLGHQVCTDYLRLAETTARQLGIDLPDRQLACMPLKSDAGRAYLSAMICASNFAWANRQCLTHLVRQVFCEVLSTGDDGLHVVYDQAHNIAKIETHEVEGMSRELCVHRKGASRSFPAGRPELPLAYRAVGQPVLVPGSMGTASYVMVGGSQSLVRSFGSACHGAGRALSRGAARRRVRGSELRKQLADRGIIIRSPSDKGLAEEAPDAYKDIAGVVNVTHQAGLATRVAKLTPLGVIKG